MAADMVSHQKQEQLIINTPVVKENKQEHSSIKEMIEEYNLVK